MRFTRLIPAVGAIPELYSYYCNSCGEAVTEVGEPGGRRDLLALFEVDSRCLLAQLIRIKDRDQPGRLRLTGA